MSLRIVGVMLDPRKHIVIALRGVFGIGATRAKLICSKLKIDPSMKVANLETKYAPLLQAAVNEYTVEGDLRRSISFDIKRLGDIKSYRGLCHRRNLPVRGQRTKTNARTRKGRKNSKGSTKK